MVQGRWRRAAVIAVSAAFMTLAVACSTDAPQADATTETTPAPASTEAPTPATAPTENSPISTPPVASGADDFSYVDLLRFIPDVPSMRDGEVWIGNVPAAEADAGVSFPLVTDTPFPWDDYAAYLELLPDGTDPVFFERNGSFGDDDERLAELAVSSLGFGPPHVDQWVYALPLAGFNLPFYVALGPFAQQSILTHLESCALCAAADASFAYEGWEVRAWGEEGDIGIHQRLRWQPPFYDSLGRGGRLAFRDGVVARTLLIDQLQGVVQADAGEIPSLADLPEWRAMAERLDQIGAYSAYVTNYPFDPLGRDGKLHTEGPFIDAYLLFASVFATEPSDGLPVRALVLYESEEDALDNADRLRERAAANYDERLLYDVQVSIDGAFVIMRYSPPKIDGFQRDQDYLIRHLIAMKPGSP
ncbi:MAG: hypothetical protein H6674_08810 [Dehalococcoidia bacterium]|nr:hypothetical protein [Dehalococcoidia bacterium]